MILSEYFNSKALAIFSTEIASNKIPFLGEAYFPDDKMMGLDLPWIKTHKGLNVALAPSNFDALPTIRGRGEINTMKEEMPFFRESMIVKEHDLMELSRISNSNDPYLQPILNAFYDDGNTLVDAARISAEMMRMSLLAPLNGDMRIIIALRDNTKYAYNYDPDGTWKANNYMELTSSDTWDNPSTAKPLNDIRKATQYLASNGIIATTIISTSETFDYLLENDQLKTALISVTGQPINFVDDSSIEEVIRRKTRLNWIFYDKLYKDYDGTQKNFYPDGYVTILGNGQLGKFWRGITPEEITSTGKLIADAPTPPADITVLSDGIAIAVQTTYEPAVKITTTVSQLGMPSFEGMDSIFVIKVV